MGWVKNATPEVEAQSQWVTILTITIVLTVLSIFIVCSRLWLRFRSHGFASDDYMAGLAMVFAIIYSILCIVQTEYGLGLPIALRPKLNLIPYTRVNYAGRPFYQLGISFFKIALLISYLRLLKGTNQKMYRIVIWFSIVLIFLAHLGCAFSLIFACHPVDKSWNPLKAGHCLAAGPSFTGYAIVTIVSDVLVALLPIPILLKLNIRLGQKIGLCAIFLLGLFTTCCSIFRYQQINRIQYGDGNSTMLVLWGVIEFNVGNIVSSLPFLAPFLKKKAKEYLSNKAYGSYGYRSGGTSQSGEHYKLGGISKSRGNGTMDQPGYAKSEDRNTSVERILPESPDHSILKTVEYNIRVHETGGRDEGKHWPIKKNDMA